MRYRWRYQDDDGTEIPGEQIDFAEQAEAEEWLSEQWPNLANAGIAEVTLLQGETALYGPMSLHPE